MFAPEKLLLDQTAMQAHIRSVLAARTRRTIPLGDLRAAAVLVPLGWADDGPRFVLTKRSMTVETHKGEISFPGGHAEDTDDGPEGTALREAQEEIGLRPESVEILGRLDDHITIFKFHITPVVGTIPYPYPFTINSEAESIVTLRLERALDDAAWMCEPSDLKGLRVNIYCIEADQGFVWGATARMIKHFIELLTGRELKPGPLNAAARDWIGGLISAQESYARLD